MSLPKIKDFTDFNHYPDDPQPTTDADMQDYMQNQNDILNALTKRLWQPQTAYKLGDIVASDAMADGLVAVCTIAGVTSDIEPEWGVNEATVIDNSCTWIMRPAYCYGLATESDVQSVHDGGSAEDSRLLSLGVLDKIFALIKARFTNLFGDNDVLPIEHGGTGATTVASARNALGLGNTNDAVPIANGGTGATTASQARTNLGLATVANTGSYNDLSNKPAIPSAYITETYVNGTSWYRKYSDGWIEQGGVVAADTNAVTLVTPMRNTNYRVLVSFEETTSSTTISYGYQSANSKTTTGFKFGNSAGAKRYWRAEG